jgi:hypothetical protein
MQLAEASNKGDRPSSPQKHQGASDRYLFFDQRSPIL